MSMPPEVEDLPVDLARSFGRPDPLPILREDPVAGIRDHWPVSSDVPPAPAGTRPPTRPPTPADQTARGALPVNVIIQHMTLWPVSGVGPNISGQPPAMTVTPCSRPYAAASTETLPAPNDRCIQTCLMPRPAASSIVPRACSGLVAMTTAAPPPGIADNVGKGYLLRPIRRWG